MQTFRSGWVAALGLLTIIGVGSTAVQPVAVAQEMQPADEVVFDEEVYGYLANWHVSVNALILDRSTPGGGATITSNPGGVPYASGSDFDFGLNGGVDFAITRRLESGSSLQVRYFGIDSIATNSFVTPGNFIGGGFTGPGGTAILGRYLTSLDNLEINYRRPWTERTTLLAGFRWIELKDELTYRIGPTARGDYSYINHMYGGQIGFDYLVLDGDGPWEINAIGKAGVFANVADGGVLFSAGVPLSSYQTSDTRAAFVGELGVNATYHVTEQFAVRVGYELLFLSNLGLASDNAADSLTNPTLLAANVYSGDVFYHGFTAGIEYAW